MTVLVTIVVVLLMVGWGIGIYNRIVGLRRQVVNGWKALDVELKRRHGLIANLVDAGRGRIDEERGILHEIISARNRAAAATGPADAARKESELTEALARFFALAESRPQLTASHDIRVLQEELTAAEDRIGAARQAYTAIVRRYNTAIHVVRNSLIAGLVRFKPAELFEIDPQRGVAARDLPRGT